jgi:hypothetical protein
MLIVTPWRFRVPVKSSLAARQSGCEVRVNLDEKGSSDL